MGNDSETPRVAVFIDASNLHHAQKENGWQIDYKKLAGYLDGFGQKCGRYYFTPTPAFHDPSMSGYRKFKTALILMGYTVVDKELKEINVKDKATGKISVKKKADLDMEMGQWMTKVSKLYNTAIIFGGDSDFVSVIEEMVLDGKYIIVIGNQNNTAIEVQNISHEFINLQTLKSLLNRG